MSATPPTIPPAMAPVWLCDVDVEAFEFEGEVSLLFGAAVVEVIGDCGVVGGFGELLVGAVEPEPVSDCEGKNDVGVVVVEGAEAIYST